MQFYENFKKYQEKSEKKKTLAQELDESMMTFEPLEQSYQDMEV